MKKLFLVRHAKSDRSMMDLEDIDRPLNERGYSDAHLIGSHLKNEIDESILLISSPAIRALSTALIFAREFNYDSERIIICSELYETDANSYLKVICRQDDAYKSVMIVGHNPTISDVIEKLNNNIENDVPTCAVSIFNINSNKWAEILSFGKTLFRQIKPSDFKVKPSHSPE